MEQEENFKQSVLDAMEEARAISRDPAIQGTRDLDELFQKLDED